MATMYLKNCTIIIIVTIKIKIEIYRGIELTACHCTLKVLFRCLRTWLDLLCSVGCMYCSAMFGAVMWKCG
jgi:hypothetical protein